jgi:1,6-anhydro-N-acetylmuramate kinase
MTTPNDDAKPSPASAGSQAVAWRVYSDDGSEAVYSLYEQARAAADEWNWSVEPLYRQPQPALTDNERETVEWAAKQMKYIRADNAAATLRSLLERLGGGR